MKKILALAVIGAMALSLGSAQAQEETECIIGPDLVPSDGGGVETCQFTAGDSPAHGFLGLTPNDFVIFQDANEDGVPQEDEIIAEVSPTELDPIAGQLDLETGVVYTVSLLHGCVEPPICGWVGVLIVG